MQSIIAHIKSYDPQISHYRRAHTPNRLYLPSTLTIVKMYKSFVDGSVVKVSYDVYRGEVHFPEGHECINHEEHIKTATIAREIYKKDAENNDENNKFSADLQKVVMLPRMPGIKTVVSRNV